MVRRGLVANARNAWPGFAEFEALGPSVVRTIVYDNETFEEALQVVPPGVDVIALLSSEHEGIGNEWDIKGIPASKIAWLVENASAPLQQAGMLRLLPSVASDHWQSALVALKNLIHLRDCDGAAFHPYGQFVAALGPPQPGYQPGLSASVTRASGLLGGVPMYVTEFGAKLSDYGGEDRQAEYVRVAYDELDLLEESRCPLACFFAWHDAVGAPSEQGPNAFGLVRADGSRRPAWYAYQTVAGGKRDQEPVPIGDYRFQLGFRQIAEAYPSLVGVPVENEYGPARGMSLQRTTTGMLYWASLTDSGIVMGFVDWRDGTRYRWASGGLMKVAA